MITIKDLKIGNNLPFVLFAGPCVVESRDLSFNTAKEIKAITTDLNIGYVFKASYRKANRTSMDSFTGLGDEAALDILREIKEKLDLPILTDVHTEGEIEKAADVADILQIPAFLSRQTDLLVAAGRTGKVVNIKKGQFLAPEDMKYAAGKVESTGNKNILLTERGTTFGYHNLVVDMRSLVIMRSLGYPVVMDATHAVQMPGTGGISGGTPEYIPAIARAAVAVGIDALFMEVHPNPPQALSDAASQFPLSGLKELLMRLKSLDQVVKQ